MEWSSLCLILEPLSESLWSDSRTQGKLIKFEIPSVIQTAHLPYAGQKFLDGVYM
jgi:hypothetical protein